MKNNIKILVISLFFSTLIFLLVNKEFVLEVDHVVICAGQLSNNSIFESSKAINNNTELIGGAFLASELDAKKAIDQAVRSAAKV